MKPILATQPVVGASYNGPQTLTSAPFCTPHTPLFPAPTRLHCPQCGWSKRETHSGDVMLPPSLIACPQCHEHKLQREPSNTAWGKTSLPSWLSHIGAKVRR